MPLIVTDRHTKADLEHWIFCERLDSLTIQTVRYKRRVDEAIKQLISFDGAGTYAGVSWGKDSVVVAHMIATHAPHVPLVCVIVEPIENPDNALVRDALLAAHPHVRYHEFVTRCSLHAEGHHDRQGTLEAGFAMARALVGGDRYYSGIRGAESGTRAMRMAMHGHATERTCAPIGRWDGADVFAYLNQHGLPVHPAYACTMGGILQRDRIRVSSLGGRRGTGHGRREWELRYYPDAMRGIALDMRP